MADSSYLQHVVEPFVARWVSQRIGVPLTKRCVVVGPRTDGTPVRFEFDGVSEDGKVGLLVSTSLTVKPGVPACAAFDQNSTHYRNGTTPHP